MAPQPERTGLPRQNGSMTKHRVAFGVLLRDGRALLCHRHPERRWYPNVWDLPGGHIEDGETPAQTVSRELSEELGVRATRWVPLETHVDVPDAETHAFAVVEWEGEPANLAPDEHDELRWVGADELACLPLAVPEVATLVAEALRAVRAQH